MTCRFGSELILSTKHSFGSELNLSTKPYQSNAFILLEYKLSLLVCLCLAVTCRILAIPADACCALFSRQTLLLLEGINRSLSISSVSTSTLIPFTPRASIKLWRAPRLSGPKVWKLASWRIDRRRTIVSDSGSMSQYLNAQSLARMVLYCGKSLDDIFSSVEKEFQSNISVWKWTWDGMLLWENALWTFRAHWSRISPW